MAKKIILTFCLLLVAICVHADVDEFLSVSTVDEYLGISTADEFLGQTIASGGGDACDTTDCSSCQYQERFECGSTDGNEEQSWTQIAGNGTFNQDYTTTALEGDESLYIEKGTTNEAWYMSITGTDNANYFGVKLQLPTGNTSDQCYAFELANNSTVLMRQRFYWQAGGYWLCMWYWNSVGSSSYLSVSSTNVQFDDDTTYWFKIKYDNGSGSDADVTIWYSTNGSSWTECDDETVTDGTDTLQVNRVQLVQRGTNSVGYIADDIRVRTDGTDIGNY